jgi:hypothetical protein
MQAPQHKTWKVAVVTRGDVDRAQSESSRARDTLERVQDRISLIVQSQEDKS